MPLIAEIFTSPVDPSAPRADPYGPNWYSVNPYGNFYYLGPGQTHPALHTGDDLTYWPGGPAHKPIYAIGNGRVIYCQRVKNADGSWSSWGNVIVIEHVRPDGSKVYSRYAHEEDFLVELNDLVLRGQPIAHVGNAYGRFAYHLHFDVSLTNVLKVRPWDWPGTDQDRLYRDYVNPTRFLQENGMATDQDKLKAVRDSLSGALEIVNGMLAAPQPTPAPAIKQATVIADPSMNVRAGPGTTFADIGDAFKGERYNVKDAEGAAGWVVIVDGPKAGGYLSKQYLSFQ
jgi:hypothetical protein